jgi:predicted DNA-binding protein
MSIQIELKPEIEAELKNRAQKNGLPVSQYVQRILEQHVPGQPVNSAMTPEERVKAFQDWVESFPYRRNEPLSDDAISRESFYRTDYE